jgi:adenosylcobinamide amidohydrolase
MAFKQIFPSVLGLSPESIVFLSTGVPMTDMAVCEKSCRAFRVCCLVTAGVKNNALRTGADVANHDRWQRGVGTINVILLTNCALSEGAMARAIITVRKLKQRCLAEDLKVRSC